MVTPGAVPATPICVIGAGGDDPGHEGAVAVVVRDLAVRRVLVVAGGGDAGREVAAVAVVHATVAVVILVVSRDLSGVGPDAVFQVGMGYVNAGVENGHHDGGVAGLYVPGRGGLDEVVVPLLLADEEGVAGDAVAAEDVVGLGVLYLGPGFI